MALFHRLSPHRGAYLLLLPYAIGLLVLYLIPAILVFTLAFFKYDGLSQPEFLGLLNFHLLFTNELFPLSVRNSLAFVILPVPLRVAGAFLVAHLLWKNGRFLPLLRTLVYLPSIMPSVAYVLIWLWLLNPLYGPINLLLQQLGFEGLPWLATAEWAKPGVALALLWQIGEGFLVSLAVLYDLPQRLHDAARVDGANSRQIFIYVTLPLVAPILVLLLLRDGVVLLQEAFTAVWLMTQGGPYYATFTLPQLIYEQGFGLLSFGTATAALWVLYLLSGFFVLLVYLLARQWQIGLTEEQFLL
jgi:multiple sugar transport system permease protein